MAGAGSRGQGRAYEATLTHLPADAFDDLEAERGHPEDGGWERVPTRDEALVGVVDLFDLLAERSGSGSDLFDLLELRRETAADRGVRLPDVVSSAPPAASVALVKSLHAAPHGPDDALVSNRAAAPHRPLTTAAR